MPSRLLSISLVDHTSEATTLEQVMKLTTDAVECLSRGAAHDDPDVNVPFHCGCTSKLAVQWISPEQPRNGMNQTRPTTNSVDVALHLASSPADHITE